MALDFNGSSNYASRTAVTLSSAHTVAAWVKFDSLTGWHNIYYFAPNDAGQANANVLNIWYNNSAGEDGTTTFATGEWHHVAFVRNGTAYNVYLDGVGEIDGTGDSVSLGSVSVVFGAWDASGDWLDGAQAYLRVWDAALSQAQVQAEMASATAVLTTGLYADWPLASDLLDDSGNARTLTFNGTPSYVAGPDLGGGTTYPQTNTGGLTPNGASLRQGRKAISATLTPAGALTRAASAFRAGVLTPAGVLLRRANRGMAGTLSPAGALIALRTVVVVLAGALAPAGAAARQAGKTAAGSLTPVGSLFKRAAQSVAGALAPVGSVFKGVQTLWAGALAGAGALTTQVFTGAQTFFVTVAGALTPSGALLKRAQVGLASALTPVGATLRRAAKGMAGALTPTGAFAALKVLLRLFTGALTPTGTLVRRAGPGMAGQLAAAGVLVRSATLRWAGSLAPIGAFTGLRTLLRTFAGALTPTGSVTVVRVILLAVAGALAPSGATVRSVGKQISGQLAPAGALARSIGVWLAGGLTAAGNLLLQVFGLSNVRLTVALADAAVTACALADSVVTTVSLSDAAATRLTLGDTLYE